MYLLVLSTVSRLVTAHDFDLFTYLARLTLPCDLGPVASLLFPADMPYLATLYNPFEAPLGDVSDSTRSWQSQLAAQDTCVSWPGHELFGDRRKHITDAISRSLFQDSTVFNAALAYTSRTGNPWWCLAFSFYQASNDTSDVQLDAAIRAVVQCIVYRPPPRVWLTESSPVAAGTVPVPASTKHVGDGSLHGYSHFSGGVPGHSGLRAVLGHGAFTITTRDVSYQHHRTVCGISDLTNRVCRREFVYSDRLAPIPPEYPELPNAMLDPESKSPSQADVFHELMWILASDPGSFRWSLADDHVSMSSLSSPLHVAGIFPFAHRPRGFSFPGVLSYYSALASRDSTTVPPSADPTHLASQVMARSPLIAASVSACCDNKDVHRRSTVLVVPSTWLQL